MSTRSLIVIVLRNWRLSGWLRCASSCYWYNKTYTFIYMYALFNENTNYPMYARTTCRVASTQLSIRNRNSVHNHFNIVILLGHTAVKQIMLWNIFITGTRTDYCDYFSPRNDKRRKWTGQNKTIAIWAKVAKIWRHQNIPKYGILCNGNIELHKHVENKLTLLPFFVGWLFVQRGCHMTVLRCLLNCDCSVYNCIVIT